MSSEEKYPMLKQVLAMAFTRNEWVSKVRTSLERALGEYAKQKYADVAGIKFDWSSEINQLLKKARNLCDYNATKTKSKFDRSKALLEAIGDAGDPVQVKDAQNRLLTYELTKEQRQIVLTTPLFDADELLAEMLDKFPVVVK